MDRFFESPEAAARSDDPGGAISEVRLVSHSPDDQYAVVVVDYNGSEPYVELCERQGEGWVSRFGVSSGDGQAWLGTGDGDRGVETTWDPPSALWNVPRPPGPWPESLEIDE